MLRLNTTHCSESGLAYVDLLESNGAFAALQNFPLQGIMSPVEYFFGCLCIMQLNYVHAHVISKFLACLVQAKNLYEVFDFFFKNTN
jgi:hypothetical protein